METKNKKDKKLCIKCNSIVEEHFDYCPYCGIELKTNYPKNSKHATFLKIIHEKRNLPKIEEIILERRQEGTNYPAIAQLWISFPKNINSDIISYYKEMKKKMTISTNVHKITPFFDSNEFCIEIRSVLPMYTWMEFFIKNFCKDYHKKYPLLKIIVRGKWEKYDTEEFEITEEKKEISKIKPPQSNLNDNDLREKLRLLRKILAEERKLPAFCIFSDKTLNDLVEKRPYDEIALKSVFGFGPVKIKQYGKQVLKIFNE